MTAVEIASGVIKVGLILVWDGATLKVKGHGKLPDDLRKEVRAHKAEVIDFLICNGLRQGQRVETAEGSGMVWEAYAGINRVGIVHDNSEWPRFMAVSEIAPSGRSGAPESQEQKSPQYFEPLKLYADDDNSEAAQVFRCACQALERIAAAYGASPGQASFDDSAFNPRSVADIEQWESAWLESLHGRKKNVS